MRQWLLFVVLIGLFACASRADPNPDDQKGQNQELGGSFCGDFYQDSPDFWNDLALVPVQFLSRQGDNLVAQFSSKLMYQKMEFTLPQDRKQGFYKTDGDWEEEISRKEFLKKFKKDFWLVAYLPSRGNAICEAHQFKDWGALIASYAQISDHITKNIETPAYWTRLKMKPVYFLDVTADRAQWLYIVPAEKGVEVGSGGEVKLENGLVFATNVRLGDGSVVAIAGHGVLDIHKDCVFNIVEVKNPRIKMAGLSWGSQKMRPRPVSREYFNENHLQTTWLAFFDKESNVLLRVVETVTEDDKNGNGKHKSKKE